MDHLCALCGSRGPLISGTLGLCAGCIRNRPDQALPVAQSVHARVRCRLGQPPAPPQTESGAHCSLCERNCRIGEGERGYCGLRTKRDSRLIHLAGIPPRGILHWYRDPLPTNCVADWVCVGSKQFGRHNLAVFYGSCTLNCLFCQNWHYRELTAGHTRGISARELSDAAVEETFCVCFFGGDPASQMLHALAAARLLARDGVVVCWETAGTSHPRLLDYAFELSLETGGCVKFDLKAHSESLHIALTGGSNQRTLENFARAARRFEERPHPPPVVASTLLVPGYVDAAEVARIARFITDQNPEIPYSLLGFAPQFMMTDLPRTSLRHAEEAVEAARAGGLKNVHVGNRHLLAR